jgi:hypothetical protein
MTAACADAGCTTRACVACRHRQRARADVRLGAGRRATAARALPHQQPGQHPAPGDPAWRPQLGGQRVRARQLGASWSTSVVAAGAASVWCACCSSVSKQTCGGMWGNGSNHALHLTRGHACATQHAAQAGASAALLTRACGVDTRRSVPRAGRAAAGGCVWRLLHQHPGQRRPDQ